jgi:hypothetical protein
MRSASTFLLAVLIANLIIPPGVGFTRDPSPAQLPINSVRSDTATTSNGAVQTENSSDSRVALNFDAETREKIIDSLRAPGSPTLPQSMQPRTVITSRPNPLSRRTSALEKTDSRALPLALPPSLKSKEAIRGMTLDTGAPVFIENRGQFDSRAKFQVRGDEDFFGKVNPFGA